MSEDADIAKELLVNAARSGPRWAHSPVVYYGYVVICDRCSGDDVEIKEYIVQSNTGESATMKMSEYAYRRQNPRTMAFLFRRYSVICRTCSYRVEFDSD